MPVFKNNQRKSNGAGNLSRVRESNGSAARCPSPGTSTIALRALLAVAEEMLEGEIAYRRGEHDAAFDRLPSGPSLQRSATNRDAGAGEASKALSF